MIVERYQLVQEFSGTWAIFDVLTGAPSDHDGRILIGLDRAEAEAILKKGIRSAVRESPGLAPR